MKTAIVYYSLEGNTRYVVDMIAKNIDADVIEIISKKKYPASGPLKYVIGGKDASTGATPKIMPVEFDSDKYECIIFATPVWASSFAPPLKTFINQYKDQLKNKKFGFYAGYKGSGFDKATEKMAAELGIESFENTLYLVDPMLESAPEKDQAIIEFANSFK